jgi:hypothetical protein
LITTNAIIICINKETLQNCIVLEGFSQCN